MTKRKETLVAVLVLTTALGFPGIEQHVAQAQAPTSSKRQPGARYEEILAAVEAKRVSFARRYREGSDEEKQRVLQEAGEYLVDVLSQQLFPRWYGTPWDFNGAARRPGEGPIACGVFVARVLAHAGFSISSVARLAQQPSEVIIKNLVPRSEIRRFSSVKPEKVEAVLRNWGKGVYIVGLDIHVGFVVNDGDSIRFVHSSYYDPPRAVVSEPLLGRNPLADSQYRVVGRLTNPTTLRKWVLGEPFTLQYDYFRSRHARQ